MLHLVLSLALVNPPPVSVYESTTRTRHTYTPVNDAVWHRSDALGVSCLLQARVVSGRPAYVVQCQDETSTATVWTTVAYCDTYDPHKAKADDTHYIVVQCRPDLAVVD